MNKREVKPYDFKYSFKKILDPKTRSPNTWVLEKILGADDFMFPLFHSSNHGAGGNRTRYINLNDGAELGGYILTEASLSFLGLGAQPPTATWGSMISANRAYISSARGWYFSQG